MNTKTTLVMAIVALVVGAYLAFVDKPWDKKAEEKPVSMAKLLFDPKPAEIDRLELVDHGNKFSFKKENSNWIMTAPIETAANDGEIIALVDRLMETKYVKAHKKDDKDRPSDKVTGLDKPIGVVKMWKGDKSEGEVTVGARLPTGKGSYLQMGGSDNILETQNEIGSVFNKRLETLRNKRVLNFEMIDVKRVEVEGLRNFALVQNDTKWYVESPSRSLGDKEKIESFLRPISNLYIQDWKDDKPSPGILKSYGLDPPRLKVTVDTLKNFPPKNKPGDANTKPADIEPTTEHKTFVLYIGGATDTSSSAYFGKMESSPMVFSVGEYVFKELTPQVATLRDKQLVKIDDLAAVTRIEADTPGGSMVLNKQSSGDWAYSTGMIADKTAVEDLLKTVKDLKATDFVEQKETMLDYDWKKPRAKISFTRSGQLEPVTILVGLETASGKMVYARGLGQDAVAVIRGEEASQLLSPPVAYQERAAMKLNRDEVNRLEVTRTGSPKVVIAKVDNRWEMTEPIKSTPDNESVRNVLADTAALRAKRVAAASGKEKYGLDKPTVALAIWTQPPAPPPSTAPAAAVATQPAGSQPSKEKVEAAIKQTETLLEYQRTHPQEEKKILTDVLVKKLAELKASTQPGGSAVAAATTTQPVAAAPVAPPPQVHRLALNQRDGLTYACVDDEPTVYELENKVFEDAMAEMHIRQVMKFEIGDVNELGLQHDNVDISLRKIGSDWKYANDPVLPIESAKVTDVLNAFRELKTHRYIEYSTTDEAKYKLDKDVSRITVGVTSGQKYEVVLSKVGPDNDADKSHYATLAGSHSVFLLKGDQAVKFGQKLEDFEKPKGGAPEKPTEPEIK